MTFVCRGIRPGDLTGLKRFFGGVTCDHAMAITKNFVDH
jgi:hypothetical protein